MNSNRITTPERECDNPLESQPMTDAFQDRLQHSRPNGLRARILERSARKTRLVCTLRPEGQECARGDVVAVRVPNEWFSGS